MIDVGDGCAKPFISIKYFADDVHTRNSRWFMSLLLEDVMFSFWGRYAEDSSYIARGSHIRGKINLVTE